MKNKHWKTGDLVRITGLTKSWITILSDKGEIPDAARTGVGPSSRWSFKKTASFDQWVENRRSKKRVKKEKSTPVWTPNQFHKSRTSEYRYENVYTPLELASLTRYDVRTIRRLSPKIPGNIVTAKGRHFFEKCKSLEHWIKEIQRDRIEVPRARARFKASMKSDSIITAMEIVARSASRITGALPGIDVVLLPTLQKDALASLLRPTMDFYLSLTGKSLT